MLSVGRLPPGYKNKRVGARESRKRERERRLSFFVVYLERETDDSLFACGTALPSSLMTPNFTANKLNNDAFESRSIYEALPQDKITFFSSQSAA